MPEWTKINPHRGKRVRYITWSCPRCGRPFVTEAQMLIHYLSCGSY